jgi:PST family polysaccharide transporter
LVVNRSENFARFAGTDGVSGDLKRKSVLGALTTGAGSALDFGLRLGSTLILARLLVPEQFGLVAMVTAVTRIAERFATLGLSTATVQAPKITHGQCSNLFWINVGAGVFFAAMLVLLSPAIVNFYEDERLQTIAVVLSLNFVWTGLTVQHEALLLRQMKLPRIAGNRLTATFVSLCLAIGLALGGFGYWALVWKEVAQVALTAVGAWMLCPWVPGRPSRRVNMDRLLRFGRDMTLTQLLLGVTAQLDNLLIGRFGGAVELGLYRQAYNLMKAPIERLRGPIYSVSQPGLSVLQLEPARYRRYYQRIVFAVSLATVPLGVFTAIYAHEIVLVVLGETWLGAVVFLRIFSVMAAIQPALGTGGIVMITCGYTGRQFLLTLLFNAMSVVLMFAGIKWGAVGVAAGRMAALVLTMPWVLYYGFAGTPVSVRDFLRSVSRPVAASLTMGAALLLLQYFAHLESVLLSLLAACGTAIAIYFLAFNLLPGGRGQLRSLKNEFLSALRRRPSAGVETSRDST